MGGKQIGFVNAKGRYEVAYFFTTIDNDQRARLQKELNERALDKIGGIAA